MLRLLCVTAHPDDEAGGFGGALLSSAARGVQTHVLCLTPGQAATHRGECKTEAELVATRREEFARSCHMLQVTHGEVLDYPDGKLDHLPFYVTVGELTRRVREIRPHIVLTFGSEGAFTAHPDHSMVSLFTTMAFHWAGRPQRFPEQMEQGLQPHRAQKLYYSTVLFTMPERPPVSLPPATAVLDITPHFEQKRAAFRTHRSQAPLFPLFDVTLQKRGHEELYHLAAASTPRRISVETDLFEGVEE